MCVCVCIYELYALFVLDEGVNDLFVISIPFVYSKYTTSECANTNTQHKHIRGTCKIEMRWQYDCYYYLLFAKILRFIFPL